MSSLSDSTLREDFEKITEFLYDNRQSMTDASYVSLMELLQKTEKKIPINEGYLARIKRLYNQHSYLIKNSVCTLQVVCKNKDCKQPPSKKIAFGMPTNQEELCEDMCCFHDSLNVTISCNEDYSLSVIEMSTNEKLIIVAGSYTCYRHIVTSYSIKNLYDMLCTLVVLDDTKGQKPILNLYAVKNSCSCSN